MGVPSRGIAEATSLSLQREPEGLDERLDEKRPKGRFFFLSRLDDPTRRQNRLLRIPAIPRMADFVTSRDAVRAI